MIPQGRKLVPQREEETGLCAAVNETTQRRRINFAWMWKISGYTYRHNEMRLKGFWCDVCLAWFTDFKVYLAEWLK